MNNLASYETSRLLLTATNHVDVAQILKSSPLSAAFNDPKSWRPYGDNANSWSIIGNQQSSAEGALAEIVTNSIDAVLMDAWTEHQRMSPEVSPPANMNEAIARYYPSAATQASMPSVCKAPPISILIRKSRSRDKSHPTLIITDQGCGVAADTFRDTFVSLTRGNKKGIPFVQGQYNMGSSGSIRYCTQSDLSKGLYKFILSKPRQSNTWGWTLIRIRDASETEKLPVIEYFAPQGTVPAFQRAFVELPGPDGVNHLEHGTVVQLYEFDLSNVPGSGRISVLGALAKRLPSSAIPISVSELNDNAQQAFFPAALPTSVYRSIEQAVHTIDQIEDEAQTTALSMPNAKLEFQQTIDCKPHSKLGVLTLTCFGFSELPNFFLAEHRRILLTVNGQTHYALSCSVFNRRLKMGELQNHMIVLVDCSRLSNQVRSSIFMPDRERKTQSELARSIDERVYEALESSDALKQYAKELRTRQAHKLIDQGSHTKDLIEQITRTDPQFASIFSLGRDFLNNRQRQGNQEPFRGQRFPTYLERLAITEGKITPLNTLNQRPGSIRILAETDAENGYLERENEPGELIVIGERCEFFTLSARLSNGTARFQLFVHKDTPLGMHALQIGFVNPNDSTPLTIAVQIDVQNIEQPVAQKPIDEQAEQKPLAERPPEPNTHKPSDPTHQLPNFVWVTKAQWREHNFNQHSGARICQSGENHVSIYINEDNCHLQNHLSFNDDHAQVVLEKANYQLFMGATAMALFRQSATSSHPEEMDLSDPDLLNISSALSIIAIPIIRMCAKLRLQKE